MRDSSTWNNSLSLAPVILTHAHRWCPCHSYTHTPMVTSWSMQTARLRILVSHVQLALQFAEYQMSSSVCLNKHNRQTKLACVWLIQLTKQLKSSVLKERRMDEDVSYFVTDVRTYMQTEVALGRHVLSFAARASMYELHKTAKNCICCEEEYFHAPTPVGLWGRRCFIKIILQ